MVALADFDRGRPHDGIDPLFGNADRTIYLYAFLEIRPTLRPNQLRRIT